MAQSFSVKGRVVDYQNLPLQFVTIKFFDLEMSIKKQSITDTMGDFQIKLDKGNYILKIDQFNKTLYEEPIKVYGDINLSTITIDNTNQLEAIIIDNHKNILERKVDRLVFNVDKSTASVGGNALDALAITPLVKVDESGEISIVSKGKVSLMVNEKIVHLSGPELTSFLRSIRSDDISKIEVLTTPPAKYESQGNSGIINIQIKRNIKSGWDGYISTRLLQNTYTGTSQSLGLNYSNEKIMTSLKANYYNEKLKAEENFKNIGLFSNYSHSKRKDIYKGVGINFGLDYQINKKSNIGFIYNLGKSITANKISENSRYLTEDIVTNFMSTNSSHDGKSPSHTINGYYDIKLKNEGDILSFTTNFYHRSPKNNILFDTKDEITDSIFDVTNESHVKYRISTYQGDVILNRTFAKLEFGVKYTTFNNHSSIEYFNITDNNKTLDETKSNEFNYLEKNYATYLTASRNLGEIWSFQLGLRYEYSKVLGLSITTRTENRAEYGKLFPSAFINFKPNVHNSFTLSYSRRINRPGFNELDPFRWYSSPNSYSTGNPQLRPSYNNNFEFSHLLKSKLSSSIYYQYMTDGYKQLTILEKIELISTYANYFNRSTYGLNITFADKLLSWWETNNAIDVSYSSSKVYNNQAMISQSGIGANVSTNNTFIINKNKTNFITVNYWMNFPYRNGNSILKSKGAFQLGAKSHFFDKKITITATVNDLFKQLKGRGTNYFQNNIQFYDNYYDSQNITIGVLYQLGKKRTINRIKKNNFSETNRVN